jgi:hypothetical protein
MHQTKEALGEQRQTLQGLCEGAEQLWAEG